MNEASPFDADQLAEHGAGPAVDATVPAEVVEYNPDSGSLILRLLGELVDERVG